VVPEVPVELFLLLLAQVREQAQLAEQLPSQVALVQAHLVVLEEL
jgi:hypothetical protein